MAYRCAIALGLALLSASAPTVWAQSARAAATDDDSQPGGSTSPALRFAATADDTQAALLQPRRRSAKRSVLEPSTTRWLEEEQPADDGSAPDDLAPPDLLSPSHGPPPEKMADDTDLLESKAQLTSGEFVQSLEGPAGETFPRRAIPRQPMMRESWLYHPFNVSVFEGALFATAPVKPEFKNGAGFFTGFRLGWDFGTHFGGETRFGFSKIFFLDPTQSIQTGSQQIFYFDTNLLIYPWGDTRVRPFISIGGGLADMVITGKNGLGLHPDVFNTPFGLGVKYRLGPRVAFRADFKDNLTFSGSGGMRTLNNIELVGGLEIHFGGGDRRSYWPWNPSHHWW
ncbi:MAG TPA: outer membrane beta-barrel protein [Pirellulales bacterium]|nr:outer membrane beta-barrel protein [Pirellulales bacterium]